jgi:hypothetical protein
LRESLAESKFSAAVFGKFSRATVMPRRGVPKKRVFPPGNFRLYIKIDSKLIVKKIVLI